MLTQAKLADETVIVLLKSRRRRQQQQTIWQDCFVVSAQVEELAADGSSIRAAISAVAAAAAPAAVLAPIKLVDDVMTWLVLQVY